MYSNPEIGARLLLFAGLGVITTCTMIGVQLLAADGKRSGSIFARRLSVGVALGAALITVGVAAFPRPLVPVEIGGATMWITASGLLLTLGAWGYQSSRGSLSRPLLA